MDFFHNPITFHNFSTTMRKIIFLVIIIGIAVNNGTSQCSLGIDTICLSVQDTLFIYDQSDFASYDWFTNNGATLSVQTGDTLVYVDWSTSSISDGLDISLNVKMERTPITQLMMLAPSAVSTLT